jgi:hypothetical protein
MGGYVGRMWGMENEYIILDGKPEETTRMTKA